ncbi:MAG: MFS transporter [Rhodoferax sp.]|nr:MFS transporter [Rhodoferax sp.]
MTPMERRASFSLAAIYGLRMLGLFLVLPVFALEAAHYPGGDDPARVGLAMGLYGLAQGLLQIPFGLASDRWGRKRVIVAGLLLMAAGSLVAAAASTLAGLMLGRALQGAGAVSAAASALLADQTRDEVRTKALAIVGGSIALTFALSLVLGPPLSALVGLAALFDLPGLLALAGAAALVWLVPAEPPRAAALQPAAAAQVLVAPAMLRLDLGVFVLYAAQIAMWVAVPALLVRAGLDKQHHWQVYLPTVLASFVVMGLTLFPMERRGRLRAVFLASIALLVLVQAGFVAVAAAPALPALSLLVFAYFCGFNVLEAAQPSLASRLAPPQARGAALGVYNTLQSLGMFAGGWAGGLLMRSFGPSGLFAVCAAASLVWLLVAWPMRAPARAAPALPKAG